MPSTLRRGRRRGNVRTSELCSRPRACQSAGGRARCASARRAWRRCASGGSPPSARRGRARRRPPGSFGPRRRGRRRGARPRSAPPRACARRCVRARCAPSATQVAAPSCSKPLSAAPIASRAARFCRCASAHDAEREQRASRAVGIADRLVLRDRLLQERAGLDRRSPRAAATRPRQRVTCASTHSRPSRSGVRLPGVEIASARRRSGRARAAARRSRASTSGCSARPTRAPRPAARASEPRCGPRSRLRSRARRARGSPGAAAGGARTALRASSSARSECSRASSSWPRWTATSAIGRWSCGTSSPYWIEMSCARAACAAASSQRPAQNSTQERPQSARALRGSSRSRHSSVLALEQGAGLVPPGRRRERVDDGERRLLHELLAADGGREVVRLAPESCGASASPANQPRMACTACARARSTSSSSSSASSSAARACSSARTYRSEARRPREPAVDDRLERRARRRLAQRFLEQRDGAVDALELGEQDERLGAQRADLRLGQQVGRDRPRARPLAGRLMRASCGERSAVALVARGRAASAGAPARRARPRRPTRRDRRPAARRRRAQRRRRRPARPSRARGDGRGAAGRRRLSRSVRARCRRSSPRSR